MISTSHHLNSSKLGYFAGRVLLPAARVVQNTNSFRGVQTDRTCFVYSLLHILYDNSFMIYAVCRIIGQKINNTYYCILW